MSHILAVDQGTSSSRAVLYDDSVNAVAGAQVGARRSSPGGP